MVRASYAVRVDWDNDGWYSGTGEIITDRIRGIETFTGRDFASQLEGHAIAGTCRVVLDNRSGDYSPNNTSSPLAGNILPRRRVQVLMLYTGQQQFPYTFPITFNTVLWEGFLQRIIPEPRIGGDNLAILEAIGPLGIDEAEEIDVAMQASIGTGAAITALLDAKGWSAVDRDIDTGQSTMTRWWASRETLISAAQGVEATESGFIRETRDAKIAFDDRHHRLSGDALTSQATFSDAGGAARDYRQIVQQDPLPHLFNDFPCPVQLYSVGSLAVLWTLAETGASSPTLDPGESKTFIAEYPTRGSASNAVAVDAWTTPVATTDVTFNSQSDGGGTDLIADLTISATAYGQTLEITLENTGSTLGYLTLVQARGTPVTANDPIEIRVSDTAANLALYGRRTWQSPPEFIPTTTEAKDWGDFHLAAYGTPSPILTMTIVGNRDATMIDEVLNRKVGDRITVTATGNAGLGINEDFFIESEMHSIDQRGFHVATYELSNATLFSDWWVVGTSTLGTSTRVAY